MKKFIKIASLVLCAVALVVASVLATLAYLQSTSNVAKNTFTVGKVAITLDEAKVDEYGVPVEGADRVIENEYKLIPSQTYTKDPTVTVADKSEPCYVRMLVTITDIADVKAVFGNDFLPQDFVNGTWDSATWISTGVVTENTDGSYTYEFRYKEVVDAREGAVKLEPLFTEFHIGNDLTETQLTKIADAKINVVAHAIQATGFANADAAWSSWAN